MRTFQFSNFEIVPRGVEWNGIRFKTIEHAYVAAKTTDRQIQRQVASVPTPGQAKRFGRSLQLRPDWEQIKIGVMESLINQKFRHDPFRARLVQTEGEIVEWNTWHDTFWGKCTCEEHKGEGQNELGRILMDMRTKLHEYGSLI